MEYLPHIIAPETASAASERRYHELLEQSAHARGRGDHWAAQQFATAAHKWAMDERARLQRLAHARASLASMTKRLETIRQKDPACATVAELYEHHPEFRGVINGWETARQLVRDLREPPADDGDSAESKGASS